jgi:hypothetical protein
MRPGLPTQEVAGYRFSCGPVAQLVEQGTFNPKVAGSNPARPMGKTLLIGSFRSGRESPRRLCGYQVCTATWLRHRIRPASAAPHACAPRPPVAVHVRGDRDGRVPKVRGQPRVPPTLLERSLRKRMPEALKGALLARQADTRDLGASHCRVEDASPTVPLPLRLRRTRTVSSCRSISPHVSASSSPSRIPVLSAVNRTTR